MDAANDGDVLGNEGRKALQDACVKVQIHGRPEDVRKYRGDQCVDRLYECFNGPEATLLFEVALVEETFRFDQKDSDYVFSISDIHDALVQCDEMPFAEKYPKPGPRSDEIKKLIDKRRDDIEKECQDATANPERQRRYPRLDAERRVRDCFAESFVFDSHLLIKLPEPLCYYISDIYEAVCFWNLEIWTSNEVLMQRRENIKTKLKLAVHELILEFYTHSEASHRVAQCYSTDMDVCKRIANIVPLKSGNNFRAYRDYTIFEIDAALQLLDAMKKIQENERYCGPVSDEVKQLVAEGNARVKIELEEAERTKEWRKYSLMEAEHRVRDCFAGNVLCDTDIFIKKEGEDTFSILDIKAAVDRFDSKKLGDQWSESDLPSKEWKESRDTRAQIKREYDSAFQTVEIEHGSGFIVQEHFAITNKHVIDGVLNDTKKQVLISNETIGQLSCEVVHSDPGKDLALLYCKELKGISPLQVSCQSLLPGMQILSFGFPMSHSGETALFVHGHVSGSKKTLSGNTLTVMNCPLNCGSSGGPILRWVNGELKVVGVASQKHFKEILTLEEREKIEKIRELMQTFTIDSVPDDDITLKEEHPCLVLSGACQMSLHLLTLKLYDALETHSQFNLSNAVPGYSVIEFVKDAFSKRNIEHKEDLSKVIQCAEDPANDLPSG